MMTLPFRKGLQLLDSIEDIKQKICNYLSSKGEKLSFKKRGGFHFCLRFNERIDEEVFVVDYCFTNRFPFEHISVFLIGFDKYLVWPHFNKEGEMCLGGDDNIQNPNKYIELFDNTRKGARKLIRECKSGEREKDFQDELPAYWTYYMRDNDAEPSFHYLVNIPEEDVAHLYFYRENCKKDNVDFSRNYWDLGISHLRRYLNNKRISPKGNIPFQEALFVRIQHIPIPKEYDKLCSCVLDTIVAKGGKALEKLKSCSKKSNVNIICCFENDKGLMMIGINLTVAGSINFKNFKTHNFGKYKGCYRLNKRKLFSVERRDHNWINGRDNNPEAKISHTKKVLIVGCGSVGSFVAQNLTMAGIGRIDLVDNDKLSSANLSRHVLGEEFIGCNKAEALAARLSRSYPHINIIPSNQACDEFLRDANLSTYDLIVCTTGYYNSGFLINNALMELDKPIKALYGFTETNACVGHAISIVDKSSCYLCSHTEDFYNELVIDPESIVQRKEPGCGGYFNPYGGIDINYINLMISDLAIKMLLDKVTNNSHYIWISSEDKFADKKLTQFGDEILKEQNYNSMSKYNLPANKNCSYRDIHDKI